MEEHHYLMKTKYSVTNGLQTSINETPYDYSILFGIRKLKSLDMKIKKDLRMVQKIPLVMLQHLGRWNNKIEFLFQG